MDNVNLAIWKKFRVKSKDTLPFVGWAGQGRQGIYELMQGLGFKTGAEIGVEVGLNAELMCKCIPGLKLKCIDPWHSYNFSGHPLPEEQAEANYQTSINRLTPYGVELMRMKSMEAVPLVADKSLDFVYIDGLHDYDNVMLDLINWIPKVKLGGIIAGHDYYKHYRGGVVRAVNDYTTAHMIMMWYLTRDRYPSFFWVNS